MDINLHNTILPIAEKLKSHVHIPVWLLTLLVPIFITIIISIVNNLESQTVVKTEVKNINVRLTRIENTLDKIIINSNAQK
jgi:hypothetical protein